MFSMLLNERKSCKQYQPSNVVVASLFYSPQLMIVLHVNYSIYSFKIIYIKPWHKIVTFKCLSKVNLTAEFYENIIIFFIYFWEL